MCISLLEQEMACHYPVSSMRFQFLFQTREMHLGSFGYAKTAPLLSVLQLVNIRSPQNRIVP